MSRSGDILSDKMSGDALFDRLAKVEGKQRGVVFLFRGDLDVDPIVPLNCLCLLVPISENWELGRSLSGYKSWACLEILQLAGRLHPE
jgi:hypothetical protein